MNRQQQRARIAQLITDLHFEEQIGDEDAALLRSLAEEAQGEPVAEDAIASIALSVTYDGDETIPYREDWTRDIGVPFARAIEAACAKKWGVKL